MLQSKYYAEKIHQWQEQNATRLRKVGQQVCVCSCGICSQASVCWQHGGAGAGCVRPGKWLCAQGNGDIDFSVISERERVILTQSWQVKTGLLFPRFAVPRYCSGEKLPDREQDGPKSFFSRKQNTRHLAAPFLIQHVCLTAGEKVDGLIPRPLRGVVCSGLSHARFFSLVSSGIIGGFGRIFRMIMNNAGYF